MPSSDEERANRTLRETTRKVGQHWETGLLWKWDEKTVPDSKFTALSRLKNLERKMDRDSAYASLYCMEMERLISNGYAVKIENEITSGRR